MTVNSSDPISSVTSFDLYWVLASGALPNYLEGYPVERWLAGLGVRAESRGDRVVLGARRVCWCDGSAPVQFSELGVEVGL